jgi:hypothetical protein
MGSVVGVRVVIGVVVGPVLATCLSDTGRDDCKLGLGLLARHDSITADGNMCHT